MVRSLHHKARKKMKKLWNKIKARLEPWSHPQKPANQWKHFAYAMTGGWLFGLVHWALNHVPETQMYLWIFGLVGVLFFAINYERNQAHESSMTSLEYWRRKWLDAVVDVIFTLLGALAGMLPWWGWSGF